MHDARGVYEYVRGVLKVDEDSVLKLENATRAQMTGALHSHFGRARAGDALLLYYAGHGTSYLIDDVWAESASVVPVRGNAVDALCPVDRGLQPDGTVVSDISDREFHAIFSLHAARLGPTRNITVVFDCSFSRRAWSADMDMDMDTFDVVDREQDEEDFRESRVRKTRPIDKGLNTMFANAAADGRIDWAALGTAPTDPAWTVDWDSHVMMGACRDTEAAWEDRGKGLFTSRLLDVLQHFPAKNFTYGEILRCVGRVPALDEQRPFVSGSASDAYFLQIAPRLRGA